MLSLSLLATLAGLGTAIYLERARDASVAPVAQTPGDAAPILSAAMVTASDTHDPLAASAAVTAPAPTRSVESPERHGGTSSPPIASPQQTARLEVAPEPTAVLSSPALTTAAAPGDAAAAPSQYWVEYGVFTGARAAKRLQQALANQGLDTVITQTHAPDGRALVRVRSSLLDHGAAKAASESARQALKLSALLHRSAAPPAQTVARAPAPSVSQGYWVQFGAFPHRQQAARLQEQLARGGIETAVSPMHATSGRVLYRVRSLALPDRDSAAAVASRAQEAGSSDFLVGQSVTRPAAAAEPSRTEDDSAPQGTRFHAAESLPFPAR